MFIVEFLLSENKKQKDNLIRNEVYTRRENLIFRGFNVTRNDSESCEHKVRMILRTMAIPNFDNILLHGVTILESRNKS